MTVIPCTRSVVTAAAEHAAVADRFAHKIGGILTRCGVRLRRLSGNPLAGSPTLFPAHGQYSAKQLAYSAPAPE